MIMPSHMLVIDQTLLRMLASFLHCDSTKETLNLTVQEFRRGVDIFAKLARGEEAGCFFKVAGTSIVAVGGLRSQ